MNKKYDSRNDTIDHIYKVQSLLKQIRDRLADRGLAHDLSKLEEPEKSLFDEFTPKLSSVEYGSDKYKEYLAQMGEALNHHYENNSHHPEYYENRIYGMNLLDVVEMFCDWTAASLRHSDGDIRKSLEINRKRFNIEDQLYNIFMNTLDDLQW